MRKVAAMLAGIGCLVASLALLAACASPGIPRQGMRGLYAAAIRDAMDARPEEVEDDLARLVPGEAGLVWRDGRVKLAAWTRAPELGRRPGASVSLKEDLAVTVAGVLQQTCRGIDTGRRERRLRLEQLLGLAPGEGAGRRFVELWVAPESVFRPCLDPDVTRSGCGLEAPEGVPEAHLRWLEARARQAHHPGGDPWTGLGYFFDWGNPYTSVGPTELVIRAGSEVEVATVESTEDYCRSPPRGEPR